jgi:hypothetical protein
MAGLVNYGSSDDEEDLQAAALQKVHSPTPGASTTRASIGMFFEPYPHPLSNRAIDTFEAPKNGAAVQPIPEPAPVTAPLVGPVLGPANPIDDAIPESLEGEGFAPLSPYSANRALIRDLTLPTVPNYDIPLSPPESPGASANVKFKHFLRLKQQGIHFNEKLAKSSALKNPSLMQKLMDFSDIDEASQYSTTLPKNLWDPDGFPERAYKEGLARSQQKILKKREDENTRGQRDAVEFVPATASGDSSRGGTPGAGGRMGQKSAAERVMAGLDRGRSNSPQVPNLKRKSRFES